MKIFLQVVLITSLLTIGVFETYAQVSCGATTAALTEPNGQATLCSDGSDAVTLTQNPADNTSGLPDYAYVIESPNGLTILESGDAPLTISPSQFGAGVGDVIYVSGFAYDIEEFNDLIGTLSNGFICSIAGLSSAQCDYISDTDDQGGLNSLEEALAFGEVLGEVEVNKISESIDLLIGIDDRADALGGICVAISNGGMGYDYGYIVEDCSGVLGCTDVCAVNFDPNANQDDGSCTPYSTTCNTDCTAGSFGGTWNPATCSCINETAPVNGCTDATACNFDATANCDDGSCQAPPICNTDPCLGDIETIDPFDVCTCIVDAVQISGCTNSTANNYNPNANCDDGSCNFACPDPGTCDDGDCTNGFEVWNDVSCNCEISSEMVADLGCTDPAACNYDANANCDDGSCDFGNSACSNPCNEPNPDDGCGLTEDSFDAATCAVINVPNCPAGFIFSTACECIMDEVDGCSDPCDPAYNPISTNNNLCAGYSTACNTDCTLGDIEVWDAAICGCVIRTITISGCTNNRACNFDPSANCDDGSCDLGNSACSDPCNQPNVDDGCDFTDDSFDAATCTVTNASNCPTGTSLDAANCACIAGAVEGCTDACAANYNPNAGVDDGSCDAYDSTCPDDTCFSFYTWDASSCSCIEAVVDYFCDDNDECTNDFVDTVTCECVSEAIANCGDVNDASCAVPDVSITENGHNSIIVRNNDNLDADIMLEYKYESESTYHSFSLKEVYSAILQLEACETYNFRTSVVCPDGSVAYSEVQTFQTSGCVDCSIKDINVNAFSITQSSAILSWDLVPGGIYTLYYRVAGDATWNEYKTTLPFIIAFGLRAGVEYEWAISVECPNGTTSAISEPITFITPGGLGRLSNADANQIHFEAINELPDATKIESELQLYPNPAKDVLHINYQGVAVSSLSIFNTTGQLIESFTNNDSHNNKIDVSDYNAGIYFIRAEIDGAMKQYKFIVDK